MVVAGVMGSYRKDSGTVDNNKKRYSTPPRRLVGTHDPSNGADRVEDSLQLLELTAPAACSGQRFDEFVQKPFQIGFGIVQIRRLFRFRIRMYGRYDVVRKRHDNAVASVFAVQRVLAPEFAVLVIGIKQRRLVLAGRFGSVMHFGNERLAKRHVIATRAAHERKRRIGRGRCGRRIVVIVR